MGLVTSISGGAGIFAVPTMLAFGIPPIGALALNRMSDVGVVTGALRNFWKAKIIEHMKSTGEWGQFFPLTLSPFAYNETAANYHFPFEQ